MDYSESDKGQPSQHNRRTHLINAAFNQLHNYARSGLHLKLTVGSHRVLQYTSSKMPSCQAWGCANTSGKTAVILYYTYVIDFDFI